MNGWKWIIPATFLLVLGVVSISYFNQKRDKLSTQIPKKRELAPKKKESTAQEKRRPASTRPNEKYSLPKDLKESLTPVKREIVGKRPDELSSVKLENNYNPEWKEKLSSKIRRDLTHNKRKNFNLEIERKKSVLKMTKNDKAKLYEVVVVSLVKKNSDYQNSYEALVDSETGEITKTWNSTIHEPAGREELKTSLRPTGSL